MDPVHSAEDTVRRVGVDGPCRGEVTDNLGHDPAHTHSEDRRVSDDDIHLRDRGCIREEVGPVGCNSRLLRGDGLHDGTWENGNDDDGRCEGFPLVASVCQPGVLIGPKSGWFNMTYISHTAYVGAFEILIV